MKTLKNVQQVLQELDIDRLIGCYRYRHPIRYEEHPELLTMTVGQIQERVKEGLRLFIERMRMLPIKLSSDGHQGLLFAHRVIRQGVRGESFDLVFIDELMEKGVECNSYAFEFSEQARILGFLVADTALTNRYIYELMAETLYEASYFGFEQEHLEAELENLRQAELERQKGEVKSRPLKDVLDDLAAEHGFTIDRESEDEAQLHHAVTEAEMMYCKHSREKELAMIRASLLEGGYSCAADVKS